ncbi:MAG: hypothetical protein AAFP04_01540 [Myxococcota bacterium]
MCRLVLIAVTLSTVPSLPRTTRGADTPAPVSGRSRERADELKPADALARTKLLIVHLEAIRIAMGRPKPPPSALKVRDATARESLFAAVNLRRRVAQLAFEQTRSNPEWRPPPGFTPSVGRVFELVDRTLVEVLRVKDALGLRSPASESLEPDSTDHDMLVAALFNAGGLVNILLDRGSSPGGSYDAITIAVHIALELHLALVESKLPLAPEFSPNKTPTDVFERLLIVFEKIREIGAKANMPVASLEAVKTKGVEHTPDDVSNVISLVIAELFWLHSLVEGAEQPVQGYSAGRKLPADAFQRAGLLIGLLDDLIRRTTANDFKSG